jgi:beta-galactosidase
MSVEEGERYELTLEGKDAAAYVFVNGKLVGYCEAPHSASAFDVTEYLKDGENTFSILLLKWCSGSYLDDQDKIRLSGLFRDVYILKRRKNGIRDFRITADADGAFTLKVDSPCPVYAEIFDQNKLLYSVTVGEDEIRTVIQGIEPWSAEIPRLYDLHLCAEGEHIRHRFGFRTVCQENGVFYFNGKPIKIYGYNRHDSTPNTGYAMTYEQVWQDLVMMKRHNANAVRCSHYPNAPFFYEMCDKIGLYVMCEADYESDGCVLQGDAHIISSHPDFFQRKSNFAMRWRGGEVDALSSLTF